MKSNRTTLETTLVRIAVLGGLGYAPKASGSVATLVAGVPAAWLLSRLVHPGWVGLTLAVILVVSWLACDTAARVLGKKDPREVVVDELAGYLVTMLGLPADGLSLSIGFVLFRIFDIWKPGPIGKADAKVKGGFGILLDDVLAGIAANLVLRAILYWRA